MIKLKDVANIYLGVADRDIIFRHNGQNAIALGLIKESKENIIGLSREVKGIHINIAYDR